MRISEGKTTYEGKKENERDKWFLIGNCDL